MVHPSLRGGLSHWTSLLGLVLACLVASTLPGAADVAATVVRINTGGPGHVVDGVEWSGCSVVDDCSGWVSGGDARTDGGTVSGAVAPASEAIYQSAWTGGQSQGVPVGGTAFTFDVPSPAASTSSGCILPSTRRTVPASVSST